MLEQTVRGVTASAVWFLSAPFINAYLTFCDMDRKQARTVLKRQAQRFLVTCKIDVEVDGQLPPTGEGCVLCHNESSFPDIMAYLIHALPHAEFAAAANVYRFFPFARGAFSRIDFHMVERGNRSATDALLVKSAERLRNGERAIWGGEGRLSGIDGVMRFKIGAALLAIRAGVPVYPIAIHGGHRLMRLGSFRARPGTIRISIGKPVPTAHLREDDARDLADKLQQIVAGLYDKQAGIAAAKGEA